MSTHLSRRGFLMGAIVTAAATALPAVAMANPCKEVLIYGDYHWALIPDRHANHYPRYFLYPSQWDRVESRMGKEFMDKCCARIEMLGDFLDDNRILHSGPRRSAVFYPESKHERQAQRLTVPRHNPQRKPRYLAERTNAIHRGALRA